MLAYCRVITIFRRSSVEIRWSTTSSAASAMSICTHSTVPLKRLVHVDYETQRRVLRRSALWYRDVVARSQQPSPARASVTAEVGLS